jgi:hypothetical protein
MSAVDEKGFNSVFISHAHEDNGFALKFQEKLREKLGDSMDVWMDDFVLEGREWRREIQRRLDAAPLVVIILSPDAIKSPWVLYEWHYCLLIQQSEPFLVHFRECEVNELKRFSDYQLSAPLISEAEDWTQKTNEFDETTEKIASALQRLSELREQYNTLTNTDASHESQQTAAYELGSAPDGLKVAAANYLIEALQFWLSRENYGYVLASIASALGRLGKKKAIPILMQLYIAQAGQADVLRQVEQAIDRLACEQPL